MVSFWEFLNAKYKIIDILELDKLQSALDKTEKKIKETDHGIYTAKEDIHHLNVNIKQKETDMKLNEQNLGPKQIALEKESAM